MMQGTRGTFFRYVLAVAIVGAAILVHWAAFPAIGRVTPYLIVFPAMMCISVLLGLGPGLVSGALGVWVIEAWFLSPLTLDLQELSHVAIIFVSVAFLGYIGRRLRQAEARARADAEAASESERRFRTAFENGAVAMALTSPDGILMQVNPAFGRMLGYPVAELAGRKIAEITHPDDLVENLAGIEKIATGEASSFRMEKRYLRRDGRIVWGDMATALVRDEQSRPLYCITHIQDITDRKRSEAHLRRIFDSGMMGVIYWNVEGGITDANDKFLEMVGYTREELQAGLLDWRRLTPPDYEPKDEFAMREVRTRGVSTPFEKEYCHRDGTRIPILIGVAMFDQDHHHGVAFVLDITASKRTEQSLRETRDLLDAILNNTHMMVACLDRELKFVVVNKPYAQADGREPEYFTGRNHFDIYPNADNEAIFKRVVETGEPYYAKARPFEYFEHPERGVGYWDWSLIPILDDGGRVALVILTMADVTALKQAEAGLLIANKQLAEADQRKDEFLAMLAHELRNPLAPVRNAIQILRTVGSNAAMAQPLHEMIDRQVTHMARLLDDLLDISRITRGKITLQRHPLVLADVLMHVVETVSPVIRTRKQVLIFEPPDDELRVYGDLDRLAQVVGNILINANKYTDEGGQIWLEAALEEGLAVIRVRDTGVGIAPEVLPHVFDLFTQADRSLDRSQGGLGIGLTMVQKLVAMHGGTAEAHSAGLGHGSEFVVRLPILPPSYRNGMEAHRELVPPPEPAGNHSRRVLVVDDVIDSANSMVELLNIWGQEACAAHDGPAALRAAADFHPEVVLLDIGLPGMDGYEVARRLRDAHGQSIFLVAMTGYGQEQDHDATREAGFDDHLIKPVDLERLKAVFD